MYSLLAQPDYRTILPAVLFIVSVLYGVLGLVAWRRRSAVVIVPLIGLMLAMGWWSLGYGLEVSSQHFLIKVFWAKIQYFGILAIPPLWLMFALKYSRWDTLLTLRNRILFSVVPLITLILVWTNDFHHLIWKTVGVVDFGNLTLLDIERGQFFWVNLAYSYTLILLGSALLTLAALRSPKLYRSQAIAILIAVSFPLLGNILYLFHLIPNEEVDLTPLFFLPAGFSLLWAVTRYHLLDVIPPAQNIILQELQDGVVLLDAQRRVLFMNRTAEEILSVNADQSLGQLAEWAFRLSAPTILPMLGKDEQQTELVLDIADTNRYVEVRISPSYFTEADHRLAQPSHLIVLHDITERKRTQAVLRSRETILQAVGLASELFLKSVSWEQNILEVLERLGMAAAASRVYIFERHFPENGISLVSQRYEWTRAGIPPQIDNPDLQNLDWCAAGFARWEETFTQHGFIAGLVRELPISERELLAAHGIISLVVMPVFVEEQLWGFIGFDDCTHDRVWSDAELDAIRTAADIFGAAITRRNIEKRLVNRQRSQSLLQEIMRIALGKSELKEMGLFLVEHMGSLIGADHCFLSLWDEAGGRTIPVAAFGVPNELYLGMKVLPGEKTLTASAFEGGHMLVVEDAQDSPHVSSPIARLFHTRSVLVIPMLSNEKKLGAILLGFVSLHRFTEEEIIVSEQAADLVALALAKFQAVDEARRRADESETLRRAGVAISETLNLEEATTRLLEQLAFVVPHDSASVQLLRDGELEIIAGEGWSDASTVIGIRFPVPGNNPNTVVLETRKPYLLHEPGDTYPEFRDAAHAAHIRSWLGVPLIVHSRVIGLLAIDSRDPQHFTPNDIDLVTTFAGQVAVAIENAQLFDEVQRLAITDGLTGLFNRRHFMELAQIEFLRARRYKRDLSLMIFDIDHFKNVNDKYGHPIGDKVLCALAALCQEKLRDTDPLGRYGGEEFIALLVESEVSAARIIADRLRCDVEKMRVPTSAGDLQITISVGVVELDENSPSLDVLIARADQALYVAKHRGRNRVAVGK